VDLLDPCSALDRQRDQGRWGLISMGALGETGPAPEPADVRGRRELVGVPSLRQLGFQLLTGAIAPVIVYQVGKAGGLSEPTSLALASLPPAASVVTNCVRGRQLDLVGSVALFGITAGLVSVLVLHGSPLLLKMRDSVVTGAFGIACIASLRIGRRPLIFYAGRTIASARDPNARRSFEANWERPTARRTFYLVTALWGVGLIGEALARSLLAVTLSTDSFVTASSLLGWGCNGALIYLTVIVIRRRSLKYAVVPLTRMEPVRKICLSLPDVAEVKAGPATEWQIGGHTFVRMATVMSPAGKLVTFLIFSVVPGTLAELLSDSHLFFNSGSRADSAGMRLDDDADWGRVAELVKDSYNLQPHSGPIGLGQIG
jgi:hypothetical protein